MKPIKALIATLFIASLGGSVHAAAADVPILTDLAPGDRIRLRLLGGGKTIRGTVDAADADEVVLRPQDPGHALLRLSPQQMEKLEVVRGKRGHWQAGALIGFVPGALFLGALTVAVDDCYRDCDHLGPALRNGLIGGAVTASVGALVGLAIRTDRWVPAATRRPTVGVSLAPAKGGFEAQVALRF